MRARRLLNVLALLVGPGLAGVGAVAGAQEYEEYPLEARVWMDRGHEPVLQRGEAVRLYYRVSESAFVAIFHIDTNGTTRLVFPNSPQENHFARGGRDYRVLFPGSSYWYVGDDPGMGYFFIVASPEPFSFADLRYSHYDGGWDLGFVGRQVYSDPYLAMDDYVAALIPDWEYIPYGLDFTSYHVEQRFDYPRFMCYDCHGFRPYYSWNPYHYACTSFRVVIYNDPYYYPVTRYRGTRVVYVQPRRGIAHFGFKERAVGEPWTPQVVVRNTPPVRQPGVAGTATRRAQPRAGAASNGVGSVSPNRSGGNAPGAAVPGVERGAVRRSGGSGAGQPAARPSTVGTNGRSNVTPGVQGANPGRTGITRPDDPGRPVVTPPRSTGTRQPSTTRTTGGSRTATPQATQPNSRTSGSRPSARVSRSSGGTGAAASNRGGGAATTTRPTVRSGGSNPAPKASSRSGGSAASSRPTVRSGGSRSTPPAARSGGSSAATRPTVRSSGATRNPPKPTARSGGSSGSSRPAVRSGGSSGASRSSAGASRSGGARKAPAARTVRPPARKKKSGGGGLL
jgi:hypothetical protein